MCGFTFTVFLSAFQLLPTAPFRILELGGTTFASGLFLGFLTYASALSAPLTGAIADRIGRRRTLLIASVVILLCAIGYGTTASYRVMLALVVVHGVFWSGLLSASAAYLTSLLPEQPPRRGHQLLGPVERRRRCRRAADRLLDHGARRLAVDLHFVRRAQRHHGHRSPSASRSRRRRPRSSRCRSGRDAPAPIIEWRVLALSVTLFLYSFGYGAITSFSAMYADAIGVTPKSLYLTVAGDRDPVDASAVGQARRPHRLPARVHAVPGADRVRPGAARRSDRRGSSLDRLGGRSSASASAPPTRSSSPT